MSHAADLKRRQTKAHRGWWSLKEVVTRLALCQRLSPARPPQPVGVLIDEGHPISRMPHALMQRLGTPTDVPSALKLMTQNS